MPPSPSKRIERNDGDNCYVSVTSPFIFILLCLCYGSVTRTMIVIVIISIFCCPPSQTADFFLIP
jgi:hypothetical protein